MEQVGVDGLLVGGVDMHLRSERLPVALIHGLEEEDGRHVGAGVRTIADLAPEAGAVVLGPGLGSAEGAFSRAVGSSIEVPMVIEAGGLSAYPSVEAFFERPSPTVLISDEAGFGRLLGLSPEEVGAIGRYLLRHAPGICV